LAVDDDIEVEYRPIKKVVISDLEELDKDELLKRVAAIRLNEQPIFLNWAEGVVFLALPASPDITEVNDNIMKGVAYYAVVTYSYMAKYQPSAQVGADRIPIIDQSRSPVLRSIARWINQREKH